MLPATRRDAEMDIELVRVVDGKRWTWQKLFQMLPTCSPTQTEQVKLCIKQLKIEFFPVAFVFIFISLSAHNESLLLVFIHSNTNENDDAMWSSHWSVSEKLASAALYVFIS